MFHAFKLSQTLSGLYFDITVDPGKRAYVFIGENGVGKTALLESLGQVGVSRLQGWQELLQEDLAAFLRRNARVHVPAYVDEGVAEFLFGRGPTDGPPVSQPLVFVGSAGRPDVANIGETLRVMPPSSAGDFTAALERLVATVMRDPLPRTTVADWFVSRVAVDPRFTNRDFSKEALAVAELLVEFDPASFEGLISGEGDARRINVQLIEGKLLFAGRPIDRLASGWTALLKILQEIVSSLAAWAAIRSAPDIRASDALIFIDELDAHLHPRWQRNLIPFLKRAFPNATFVVTTHSPLVVRDTEPGEAYELVRNDTLVTARRLGSPRDWYFSDVLGDGFHVELQAPGSEGPDPLIEQLEAFSDAVRGQLRAPNAERRVAALALYEALRARMPADDPRLRTAEQVRELLG